MCHDGVHLYMSSCALDLVSSVSGVVAFHVVGSWCSLIDLYVMVTYADINYVPHYPHDGLRWGNWWGNVTLLLEVCALL